MTMSPKILLMLVCVAELSNLILAGSHKKVVIHVPLYIKHHHHKHTVVKHVHHKSKSKGDDDHYEVLGYTYGEPKAAKKGHKWHFAEDSHSDDDSPVSFEGSERGRYALSGDEEYIIRY